MEIYFAPLEGITGYLYRSAYRDNFSGVNKYFTPFLSPNQNRALGPMEIKDACSSTGFDEPGGTLFAGGKGTGREIWI